MVKDITIKVLLDQKGPIPEALIPLIDKIKNDMRLQYDLNQVLVNKYENSATLPPHSDDEGSIKPDSSIFTVSLGSFRKN